MERCFVGKTKVNIFYTTLDLELWQSGIVWIQLKDYSSGAAALALSPMLFIPVKFCQTTKI